MKTPITLQVRKLIHEGVRRGLSFEQTARLAGVAKSTVGREIKAAGGRDLYDPEKAQRRADRTPSQKISDAKAERRRREKLEEASRQIMALAEKLAKAQAQG